MTSPARFPAEALRRLAARVVDGDVVFFIGSGFSIDSEGNSARRLILRLLIRLFGLTDTLAAHRIDVANDITADLFGTFNLGKPDPAPMAFRLKLEQVDTLAARYYETNDWFCVAFSTLLAQIPLHKRNSIIEKISAREEEIRSDAARQDPDKLRDDTPLRAIDKHLVAWAHDPKRSRVAGKALFLDAMGFRCERVMGGKPALSDPEKVLASYGSKLLPRHHIVARLAREGFCSTTITANFDLLLEGAFRAAGFTMGRTPVETVSPPTYYDDFARIASPSEFFTQGKGHRSALLVKMHGCAEQYRHAARDESGGKLAAYLPSMVFTYREIQNWRQDSWAADYLRTLMRTRTVVFCGYSVQDPVIHDTFRTVYEDMARISAAEATSTRAEKNKPDASAAPAFFLAAGMENKREFHGMEVLHAASRAFGTKASKFNEHPNYLRFHYRSNDGFPWLDEQLQWLAHEVYRLRQVHCLESFLHRSVTGFFGAPKPDAELDAVRVAFDDIVDDERRAAEEWDETKGRREQAAICSWTSQFHSALMREFASIEIVQSKRGPSRTLSLMRRLPWYYPTTAAPGWVCWCAVVELALRNMIKAAWYARARPAEIRAAASLVPTVLFTPARVKDAGRHRAPVALTIRFRGFERYGTEPQLAGFPVRRVWWELSHTDAPWPLRNDDETPKTARVLRTHRHMRAPAAGAIWEWAVRPKKQDRNDALRYLGIEEAE